MLGSPPPKKLQGVLDRTLQLGKQVAGERECCAPYPPQKKLQGVLERAMQVDRQVTDERECWVLEVAKFFLNPRNLGIP